MGLQSSAYSSRGIKFPAALRLKFTTLQKTSRFCNASTLSPVTETSKCRLLSNCGGESLMPIVFKSAAVKPLLNVPFIILCHLERIQCFLNTLLSSFDCSEVGILSLIFAGSCLHVSIYTCLFGKLCCILRKNTCRTTAFEAGFFLRTKACRTRVDCDRQPICVFFLCLQQNYARKSARRFRAKPSGRLYAVFP